MRSLELIDSWPVEHAAAAVLASDGTVLGSHGDQSYLFRLASVTKLLTAYAVLIAVEEGAVELDDAAGPPRSTVRHLLAHTSGLDFMHDIVRGAPGARRIYSNKGIEVLAESLEKASGIPVSDYVRDALLVPLGMVSTVFEGSPAAGASSTVADLVLFAAELQRPRLLDPRTLAMATQPVFPQLMGVLPGFGRQEDNAWGLGFEIRDHKSPHWTGSTNSPATFGHFGQSGTFLWVDPVARIACVALTDRDFDTWAAQLWPEFSDAVLAEARDLLAARGTR